MMDPSLVLILKLWLTTGGPRGRNPQEVVDFIQSDPATQEATLKDFAAKQAPMIQQRQQRLQAQIDSDNATLDAVSSAGVKINPSATTAPVVVKKH